MTSPSSVPEKPEMYAGPVDQDVAGPVRPKQELQTQGTILRKAVPPSTTLAKNPPEKYSTPIAELEEHEKPCATYYPVASHSLVQGMLASSQPDLLKSRRKVAQTTCALQIRSVVLRVC